MDTKNRFWPLLILLVGAALRFHALAHDARLHPDEALFATFARKAAVNGDWLLGGSLDKTPLSIYAKALSMMLVGVRPLPDGVLTLDIRAGEFAARLPGMFASILLLAVLYALAKRLYGSTVALVAAFLLCFSPYAVAFSATAFTDGLMLLCIVLALYLAARGSWGWAGVWLALGYAAKQQALLYLPLVAAVVVIQSVGEGLRLSPAILLRGISRVILPLLLAFLLLAIWDAARAQDTPLLALAAANNDPGRLVYPDELLPRLRIWVDYAGYLLGSPWLTAALAAIAAIGLLRQFTVNPRARSALVDAALLLYVAAYLLLHWLVALPTHDRYLLPILPPVILLAARGMNLTTNALAARYAVYSSNPAVALCLCVSALIFFPAAFDAAESRAPVGGDRGQHEAIDQLGAYLDSRPLGTIIYDHWLGWELGYYLGAWSNKRLTYYPHAGALADDAAAQPDPAPRYFAAPARAAVEPWLDRLAGHGFKIYQDYRTSEFVVYRLIPPQIIHHG